MAVVGRAAPLFVNDPTLDHRWPEYSDAAEAANASSVLAILQ